MSKLLTCAAADSRIDVDGFHFLLRGIFNRMEVNGPMVATVYHVNDVARTLFHYTKDFNAPNKHGWTALHFAALMGNKDHP